jgi:hypothetical protein
MDYARLFTLQSDLIDSLLAKRVKNYSLDVV